MPVVFLLLLYTAHFAVSQARAQSGSANSAEAIIGKIENRLFFRPYPEESASERLDRIEKQMFGETFSGAVEERLARIAAVLPPEKDKPASAPAPVGDVTTKSAPAALGDDEDDNERKRLAALAARDEEVARLMAEGVEAYRGGNSVLARERFQQVIRLDPQNAQAFYSLGIAAEAKGASKEAREFYTKAVSLEPGNKDFSQALKTIEKKLGTKKTNSANDSNDAEAERLARDAAAAYKAQEFLSALDLYKQLDAIQPRNALTKFNIGTVYLVIKKPVSALEYYKEACKLKPGDAKYAQSLKELETSINKDDAERQKAESAWDNRDGQGSALVATTKHGSASDTTSSPPRAKGEEKSKKAADPLVVFGLQLKGGKDGLRVVGTTPDLRAAQVGLKEGDVIKAVDGNVVTNVGQVRQLILSKPFGTRFALSVQRGERLGQIVF